MNGENNQKNAYNLRKLADQDLIRVIKNTRLDIGASYGMMADREHTNQKATVTPVDPRNKFRRRLIARCITILSERGIKGDF